MSRQSRPIREAAVQFLYSLHIEAPQLDQINAHHDFWDTLLDRQAAQLLKAQADALLVAVQGRHARIEKVEKQVTQAKLALMQDERSEPTRLSLERFLNAELALQGVITLLEKSLRNNEFDLVASSIKRIYLLDSQATANRHIALRELLDYPKLTEAIDSLTAVSKKLDEISKRIRSVENPSLAPQEPFLSRIIKLDKEIQQLRSEASHLVHGTWQHLTAIDRAISDATVNFAFERIGHVDLAVLRLATWELLFDRSSPAPVVINEAIEIVRTYGSPESSKFVNGILDSIYKKHQNA